MIMENRTVSQVKKAIRKWPAYIKFAENRGVNPLRIKNISELPIVEKNFISKAIHTVPLTKVRSIVPSSGSTNTEFSYGLFGDMELRKTSGAIDRFLQERFNTKEKKTVILNLLPGSISFHSSSASVVSIGIRSDTAVSAIKSLGSSFEQIILVGEPLFIKNLIEDGIRQSIIWEYLPLFVVVFFSHSSGRAVSGAHTRNPKSHSGASCKEAPDPKPYQITKYQVFQAQYCLSYRPVFKVCDFDIGIWNLGHRISNRFGQYSVACNF